MCEYEYSDSYSLYIDVKCVNMAKVIVTVEYVNRLRANCDFENSI